MHGSGKQNSIIQALQAQPLFRVCTDAFMSRLAGQASLSSPGKGHVLIVHEEPATRFFIITGGWIKLYRETLDGTQAVVDILTTGHIFGETALFEDNVYPYSAEAVEESEIISLPLNLIKSEIEENPKFAMAMLSHMAHHRRKQDQELEHRILQNAPQRIGCFLLRLINQPAVNGAITIHLPYDKTLVAARLGMQPETFSRALAKLKAATGIEVHGASIKMDSLDQLVRYSCAACSSEFPCKDIDTHLCTH